MKYVSRQQWGARAPKSTSKISLPVRELYIHHTDSPNNSRDWAATVRGIQAFHMDSRGYADIAYEALVAPDGSVYEGRDVHAVGAHTMNNNSNGHAIAFLGTFQDVAPTKEALDASRELIAAWQWLGVCTQPVRLFGHRDKFATGCPGDALYNLIGYINNPWTPTATPGPDLVEDESLIYYPKLPTHPIGRKRGVRYDRAGDQLIAFGCYLVDSGGRRSTPVPAYGVDVFKLDGPYAAHAKICGLTPNPLDPNNQSFIVVGEDMGTFDFTVRY